MEKLLDSCSDILNKKFQTQSTEAIKYIKSIIKKFDHNTFEINAEKTKDLFMLYAIADWFKQSKDKSNKQHGQQAFDAIIQYGNNIYKQYKSTYQEYKDTQFAQTILRWLNNLRPEYQQSQGNN